MRLDLGVTDVSKHLEQRLARTETQAMDRGDGFYVCGNCEFCGGEKKTTRENGI